MQEEGTWNISSNKVNVDTLASGDAVLVSTSEFDQFDASFEITFPTSSSTNKAGFVFSHDGNDNFYSVRVERANGKLALVKFTSGTAGSDLASGTASISDSTAYTVKVQRAFGPT